MASDNTGANADAAQSPEQRLKLYAIVAVVIVILAAVSFLFVPYGNMGSASRCNALISQQGKYSCIEATAIYAHNSTMCGLLPQGYNDYCYFSIAENTSNAYLCGKINDTMLGSQCYMYMANYTKDAGICAMMNSSAASNCRYRLAVETKNYTLCSEIGGVVGQSQCGDTIRLDEALGTKNSIYCSEMQNNDNTTATESILQNSSFGDYPKLGINVSQLFEFMAFYNQSIGGRDTCYASIAYESSDPTYCGEIVNQNFSTLCTDNVAPIAAQANLTNSTVNMTQLYNTCTGTPDQIAQCRYTFMSIEALKTGNLSICESIPQNYSATCFYYLAKKYNSTTYCGYIKNATLNQACVGDIGGLYPNVSTSG